MSPAPTRSDSRARTGPAPRKVRAGRIRRKVVRRPAETVLRSLARSFGLVRRILAPHFANFGVSVSQWGVLRTLHRAEDEGIVGLRLCDLGARLLVQPPSITGVVERLKRLGLLTATVSASDQRVREVRLTASGRERVDAILVGQSQRLGHLLAGLARAEQDELRRLLDTLNAHLESLIDPCDEGNGGDALAERDS